MDETELADGVDVEVTLPESTQPGDTITVTVTDPNGDETEIEGTVPTDWDGSSPVTVTIPPETMDEDGTHTVDVTVTDAAGNESTPSDTISFEVDAITDLTAPTLAVAEAADGVVDVVENADGVQVQVTPPAEASAGDEITVTLTQPDGNSISISNTIPSTWNGSDAVEVTVPAFSDGDYSVVATVGDSPNSNVETFAVDSSPIETLDAPVVAIAEADDGFVNGEEAANGVQVQIDLPDGIEAGDSVTVSITQPNGTVLDLALPLCLVLMTRMIRQIVRWKCPFQPLKKAITVWR